MMSRSDDRPANRGQSEVDRPRNLPRDDRELRLMLDPTTDAPRLARRALTAWPAAVDLDPQVTEDVLVVVSELVTNAVRHAQSPSEVIATIADGAIRLEVHDLRPDPPVIQRRSGEGGRGLNVVAGLAHRWGWRPTTTGKYVWTETDCGAQLAGRPAP